MDKILGCLSKPSSAAEHEEDDKNVEKMFAGCASTKKELGASNPTSNVGLLAKHGRETDGRIIAIQLKKKELTGSINFASAPRSLVRIDLSNNALTGRLDLTELPLTLCFLDVRNNKFSGTVDLTRLPNELIELNFTNNELSGVLELGSLPKKLVALYANGNKFTAVATSSVESIKAAKLEADVRRCRGDSDSAVVETEPKNGTAFVLAEGSAATDDFKIERLPKSLRYLNLVDNPFTAGRTKPDTTAVDYMLWW